jgi:hypothetical protein
MRGASSRAKCVSGVSGKEQATGRVDKRDRSVGVKRGGPTVSLSEQDWRKLHTCTHPQSRHRTWWRID